MRVDIIETPELGDRSYVVSDGSASVVVDPQRDLDRVEAVLAEQGAQVRHVLETHVHNDYLTGGFALAREYDVPYLVSANEQVSFDRVGVRDDDRSVRLNAILRWTFAATKRPGPWSSI